MPEKVGIFIAGVQKGGTSSMHCYLSAHPELAAPSRKETHFFDDESRDWRAPDYSALHRLFPPADGGRQRFESTPITLFWPPALERIRAYNPAAKLILLFRDPIERAWSNWRMEHARGAETLPFGAAIREGRTGLGPDPLAMERRFFSYVERGFYAGQVRRALQLFPREQMLFLRSADLLERQAATLAAVAEFLRVSPFPDLAPARAHRSLDGLPPEPPAGDVAYLREVFRADVIEFSGLTGLAVTDWLTMRGG
jgi:hypothetical protein